MRDEFHQMELHLFGRNPRPSIPIKAYRGKLDRLEPSNSSVINLTSREITALALAAQAQNVEFRSGAHVARVFEYGASFWNIEKGCGQDIVHSGAANLISAVEPADDIFVLTQGAVNWAASRAIERAWQNLEHVMA